MTVKSFPDLKGKSEVEIESYLKGVSTNRSYNSNYNISYLLLDRFPISKGFDDIWSDNIRTLRTENPGRDNRWGQCDDACFVDLPYYLRRINMTDCDNNLFIVISYSLTPFDEYGNDYYDEDDYYDGDDYSPSGQTDLSSSTISSYCEWMFKHKLHPEFDINDLLQYETYVVPLNFWKDINDIYWSLTMMRYLHEGQGLIRMMMKLDSMFDLDPYVNVALSHYLVDRHYNGGHCACDISYWWSERFGHWGGDHRPAKGRYRKTPLYLSQIAHSMRWLMESNVRKLAYPSDINLETTLKRRESRLNHKTPTTWRGLLRSHTRRK
jgi:hypothetical protein